MNQRRGDQVARLLTEVVHDITHTPQELASRLEELKAGASAAPPTAERLPARKSLTKRGGSRRRRQLPKTLAAELRRLRDAMHEEAETSIKRLQTATRTGERLTAQAVMGLIGAAAIVHRRTRQASRTSTIEAAATAHRTMHDLLLKAIDDPELAVVIDAYDTDLSDKQRRQFLYANALYANALFTYRTGVVDRKELHGHLRQLLHNPVFREYWEATRSHRAALPKTSTEAEIGRMADELARNLEDADVDEWWVVGRPD
ncbi:DUF6082 family protein [Streptomyces sp. NPDC093248]|uniref:DUF6082 family protein n=1 Tax=Streptomyces sp. NPDC093248 TaxID=3155072 RepID=UPI003441CB9B